MPTSLVLAEGHLKALGRIATDFASLEEDVADLVGLLVGGARNVGPAICAQLSFQSRLEVLSALALANASEPLLKRILECIPEAEAIQTRRNQCIHSRWSEHLRDGHVVVSRSKITNRTKAGPTSELEEVPLHILDDLVNGIEAVREDIWYCTHYLRERGGSFVGTPMNFKAKAAVTSGLRPSRGPIKD